MEKGPYSTSEKWTGCARTVHGDSSEERGVGAEGWGGFGDSTVGAQKKKRGVAGRACRRHA